MSELGLIQPSGLSSISGGENQKLERFSGGKVDSKAQVVLSSLAKPIESNFVKSNPSELKTEMEYLNSKLETQQSYLKFEVDESTDKMVFFIKNRETNEVLRQFPSEEFLAISRNITNFLESNKQSSVRGSLPVGTLTSQIV